MVEFAVKNVWHEIDLYRNTFYAANKHLMNQNFRSIIKRNGNTGLSGNESINSTPLTRVEKSVKTTV